jgi:malate dehydrogenase (oxaloacetate-decarboxylating)(NADP+)
LKELAKCVTDEELSAGCLYPALQKVPEISIKIAVAVANECYKVGQIWINFAILINSFKDGTAKLYPEPENKELFVRSQVYNTEYEEMVPKMMVIHKWPIK